MRSAGIVGSAPPSLVRGVRSRRRGRRGAARPGVAPLRQHLPRVPPGPRRAGHAPRAAVAQPHAGAEPGGAGRGGRDAGPGGTPRGLPGPRRRVARETGGDRLRRAAVRHPRRPHTVGGVRPAGRAGGRAGGRGLPPRRGDGRARSRAPRARRRGAGLGGAVGALDAVLLARVGPPPRVAPEVAHAWDVLCASGGKTPVAAVAEEVGWSRRHLAQRFGAELGLSPKTAARVLRFERSRGLLVSRRRPRLADVAATAGYADQAHLTREWREIAGPAADRVAGRRTPIRSRRQKPAAAS